MCSPDKKEDQDVSCVDRTQSGQFGPLWASPSETYKAPTRRFWTKARVSVVVLTVLGCMVQCASYSVIQPFFPQVAKEKGNDATQIGIVFSTFPFIGFVSSPLIGKMLSAGISPKSMLIGGLAIDGTFLTLMGSFATIADSTMFFLASMGTRLIEAIGFSVCLTCYNTLIGAQFPDSLQIMVPLVETVFGFGIMMGPAVGGVLYDVGGYKLPFIVFGSCSILFACLAIAVLPNEQKLKSAKKEVFIISTDKKQLEQNAKVQILSEPPKMKTLLKDWRVVLDVMTVVMCCFVIGFNGSTLALRTKELGLSSASQSSLVFLTYGIIYALSSLGNGVLSNRLEDCRFLVLIGGVIFCAGLVLLGPLPFVPIEPSWWLLILSQALMGIGNGAIYNLSYVHTLKYVINRLDFPPEASTYALVACLFSTGFFLGAFLGPIVGGLLVDVVGYRWATSVALAATLLPIVPMFPLVLRDHFQSVLQSTPLITIKI